MVRCLWMRTWVLIILVRKVEAVYLFLCHSGNLAKNNFNKFMDGNKNVINPVPCISHLNYEAPLAREKPISNSPITHLFRNDGLDFNAMNHARNQPSSFSFAYRRETFEWMSVRY